MTTTEAHPMSDGTPAEQFFAAARDNILIIQRCQSCGAHQFTLPGLDPGVELCRTCGAPRPPWVASQGVGEIVSFTIMASRSRSPEEPTVRRAAGIVQLTEGPWVLASFGGDPDALANGQQVRVSFPQAKSEQDPVPVFIAVTEDR